MSVAAAYPLDLNLDNKSVFIDSYDIGKRPAILDIIHQGSNYLGKVAILSNDISKNDLIVCTDTITLNLSSQDNIHLVYAGLNNINALNIKLNKYSVPMPPFHLTTSTVFSNYSIAADSIKISWIKPLSPDSILYYLIYRNDEIIGTNNVIDLDTLNYIDFTISKSTHYIYEVTCVNNIGESERSNSITVYTWPMAIDVEENQIICVYPNPIRKTLDSQILYALNSDYSNISLELINIRGQVVKAILLKSNKQGWHHENINNLIEPTIVAGIYFIRLRTNHGFALNQSITIIP